MSWLSGAIGGGGKVLSDIIAPGSGGTLGEYGKYFDPLDIFGQQAKEQNKNIEASIAADREAWEKGLANKPGYKSIQTKKGTLYKPYRLDWGKDILGPESNLLGLDNRMAAAGGLDVQSGLDDRMAAARSESVV